MSGSARERLGLFWSAYSGAGPIGPGDDRAARSREPGSRAGAATLAHPAQWDAHGRAVDAARFRDVLSRFASGVVVVTAIAGDRLAGLTCQSFTALSLEPPMVLFCPARTSTSWPAVDIARNLCVNILSTDQDEVSNRFARPGTDKFAGVAWTPLANGAPALEKAAAHIGARIAAVHDGGDHYIVTCNVQSLHLRGERDPLLYYRSGYRHLRSVDRRAPAGPNRSASEGDS
jgi:3-hydroxy-9,10-secoandrosta-1,3,5(10)-triene-9,17-dione monooxygenase reductase component